MPNRNPKAPLTRRYRLRDDDIDVKHMVVFAGADPVPERLAGKSQLGQGAVLAEGWRRTS